MISLTQFISLHFIPFHHVPLHFPSFHFIIFLFLSFHFTLFLWSRLHFIGLKLNNKNSHSMKSLNVLAQKAWTFSNGFTWPGYRPYRKEGKAILTENTYTWNSIVLEGNLQYSVHTIIHAGKSLKTFRRLRMVSGYSFEFPTVGVFVWACGAFTLSGSWKALPGLFRAAPEPQVTSGAWNETEHTGSVSPSRGVKTSEI